MRNTDSATGRYSPAPPPDDPAWLLPYLQQELARIAAMLGALADGHIERSHETPIRPRDGDIRYFDGSDVNPGSGEGLYAYYGSAWNFLGPLYLRQGSSSAYLKPITTANVTTTGVGTVGGGEDTLISYTMPASSFSAAGKGVHITAWGTTANNAETKTLKLYFGSTVILTNALTASIAGVWRVEADVISTGTDAQDYVAQLVTTGAAGVALNDIEVGTSTQDDGAGIVIKCTGDVGAPSTDNGIVQEGLRVAFIN